MRNARNLFLLCVAMAIGTAFAASTASAQSLEVWDEARVPPVHCGAVTEGVHSPGGGCHIAISSIAIDLRGHVFGIESEPLIDCGTSFEMRSNEDGEGYLTSMNITPGAGGNLACTNVRNCNSENGETHPNTHGGGPGDHSWRGHIREIARETLQAVLTVCFITGQAIPECEGTLTLPVTKNSEDLYLATANDAGIPTGSGTFSTHCEVNGVWSLTSEPSEDTHINHL